MEPLHFVGAAQNLASLLGQLLQGTPPLVQFLQGNSCQLRPSQHTEAYSQTGP